MASKLSSASGKAPAPTAAFADRFPTLSSLSTPSQQQKQQQQNASGGRGKDSNNGNAAKVPSVAAAEATGKAAPTESATAKRIGSGAASAAVAPSSGSGAAKDDSPAPPTAAAAASGASPLLRSPHSRSRSPPSEAFSHSPLGSPVGVVCGGGGSAVGIGASSNAAAAGVIGGGLSGIGGGGGGAGGGGSSSLFGGIGFGVIGKSSSHMSSASHAALLGVLGGTSPSPLLDDEKGFPSMAATAGNAFGTSANSGIVSSGAFPSSPIGAGRGGVRGLPAGATARRRSVSSAVDDAYASDDARGGPIGLPTRQTTHSSHMIGSTSPIGATGWSASSPVNPNGDDVDFGGIGIGGELGRLAACIGPIFPQSSSADESTSALFATAGAGAGGGISFIPAGLDDLGLGFDSSAGSEVRGRAPSGGGGEGIVGGAAQRVASATSSTRSNNGGLPHGERGPPAGHRDGHARGGITTTEGMREGIAGLVAAGVVSPEGVVEGADGLALDDCSQRHPTMGLRFTLEITPPTQQQQQQQPSADTLRDLLPSAALARLGGLARALRAVRDVGIDWAAMTDASCPEAAGARLSDMLSAKGGGAKANGDRSSSSSMVGGVGGGGGGGVPSVGPQPTDDVFATAASRLCADPQLLSIIQHITDDECRARVRELVVARILRSFAAEGGGADEGGAAAAEGRRDEEAKGGGDNNNNSINTTTNNKTAAVSSAAAAGRRRHFAAADGSFDDEAMLRSLIGPSLPPPPKGAAQPAASSASFVPGIAYGAQMLAALVDCDLISPDAAVRLVGERLRRGQTDGAANNKGGEKGPSASASAPSSSVTSVKGAVAVLGLLAERLAHPSPRRDAFLKAASGTNLQPLLQREAAADPRLDYEAAFIGRSLGWHLPGPRLRLLQRFPSQAHTKAIISTAYFSVTDDLVTGSYDGTVAVWGAPTYVAGGPAARLALPPGYVPAAIDAFTRGRIIAVACAPAGPAAPASAAAMIRLYQCPDSDPHATSWRLVETIERRDANARAVITCLKRINLKTNAFVTAEYGSSSGGGGNEKGGGGNNSSSSNSAAFSNGGVASHNLLCYNMQGKVQRRINGAHTDFTTVLQPSADYGWLWSGSRDTTVKAWDSKDFSTNAPLHTLTGHTDTITGVCTAGDYIVTSSLDGKVLLWDIRRLRRPVAERTFAAPVLKVACCGAQRPTIVASTTQSLSLLSFPTLAVEDVVANTSYTDLRPNHDGSVFFATGAEGCDMYESDPHN